MNINTSTCGNIRLRKIDTSTPYWKGVMTNLLGKYNIRTIDAAFNMEYNVTGSGIGFASFAKTSHNYFFVTSEPNKTNTFCRHLAVYTSVEKGKRRYVIIRMYTERPTDDLVLAHLFEHARRQGSIPARKTNDGPICPVAFV